LKGGCGLSPTREELGGWHHHIHCDVAPEFGATRVGEPGVTLSRCVRSSVRVGALSITHNLLPTRSLEMSARPVSRARRLFRAAGPSRAPSSRPASDRHQVVGDCPLRCWRVESRRRARGLRSDLDLAAVNAVSGGAWGRAGPIVSQNTRSRRRRGRPASGQPARLRSLACSAWQPTSAPCDRSQFPARRIQPSF